MLTFTIDADGKEPIYMQIYRYIRSEIESGRLCAGDKLPSKRGLSSHLRVSVVTVENAYGQLLSEGYVYTRPGSGFYVEKNVAQTVKPTPDATREEVAPKRETRFDFSADLADLSLFPFATWAKLSRATLNMRTTDLLNRCDLRGVLTLREEIAQYLHRSRGMDASPERIVVGAGSEHLIGLLVQLLGRDAAYGVENPGYKRVYDVFSANASRVFPVPIDAKGASVDAISGFDVDVVHVTPSHQFPLGAAMPISRRRELLEWAYSKQDRYVVEDDCACEFCYENRPAPTLHSLDRQGRVVYLNTFTRTLAPSIRIGYMVLPEELMKKFQSRFARYSSVIPVFEQYTLAAFVKSGQFERHVNRIKKIYKQRRDAIVRRVQAAWYRDVAELTGQNSGLHLVLRFNDGTTQNALVDSAARDGVKLRGLTEYYSFPVSNIPEGAVILGYSGLDVEQIENAFDILWRDLEPK